MQHVYEVCVSPLLRLSPLHMRGPLANKLKLPVVCKIFAARAPNDMVQSARRIYRCCCMQLWWCDLLQYKCGDATALHHLHVGHIGHEVYKVMVMTTDNSSISLMY